MNVIQNAYNLENYFRVRERANKQNKNKTGKKSKKILIVFQMPFHSHLNLVIRYFQDAGINILR